MPPSSPIIAITMGDAAGIGPEVIVKSLSHPEVYSTCRPVVIGDTARLQQAVRITGSPVEISSIAEADLGSAGRTSGIIDCIDMAIIPPDLPWEKYRLSPEMPLIASSK